MNQAKARRNDLGLTNHVPRTLGLQWKMGGVHLSHTHQERTYGLARTPGGFAQLAAGFAQRQHQHKYQSNRILHS
jgi:hypothetical protein